MNFRFLIKKIACTILFFPQTKGFEFSAQTVKIHAYSGNSRANGHEKNVSYFFLLFAFLADVKERSSTDSVEWK